MTHAGYVIAGYAVTFGALGAYVAWMAVRSRALARSSARALVDSGTHAAPPAPDRPVQQS